MGAVRGNFCCSRYSCCLLGDVHTVGSPHHSGGGSPSRLYVRPCPHRSRLVVSRRFALQRLPPVPAASVQFVSNDAVTDRCRCVSGFTSDSVWRHLAMLPLGRASCTLFALPWYVYIRFTNISIPWAPGFHTLFAYAFLFYSFFLFSSLRM